jgi:ribosomal protein L37AE/L43A
MARITQSPKAKAASIPKPPSRIAVRAWMPWSWNSSIACTGPAAKLIRLYEVNAGGLLDDQLVDDVGWRLWDRLSDVVRVTEGRVRCPACTTEFPVRAAGRSADEVVPCPRCNWSVTPAAWHASWRHRGLHGACPEFARFVAAWPAAGSIRDRMLLIDAVVHALHAASRSDMPGNFAARNILEGSRPKIVALLDELAEGPGSHIADGARQRWNAA